MNFINPELNIQELLENRERKSFPKIFDILILVVFSLSVGLTISFQKSYIIPDVKFNEIAKEDIIAPFDFETIDYKATEAKKAEASRLVNPVFYLDSYKYYLAEKKIKDIFSLGRDFLSRGEIKNKESLAVQLLRDGIRNVFELDINPEILKFLVREKFDFGLEQIILSLLKNAYDKGIFLTKTSVPNRGGNITIIYGDGKSKEAKIEDSLDFVSFKKFIEDEAKSNGLEENVAKKISSFCSIFIFPNLVYDETLTENKKREAVEKVYPILMKVSKGKIILKKGEKVSQEDFQIISALKKKIGVPLPFQRFLFYFFVILSGFLMALPFYRIFSFFDISPRKRHLLFLTLIFFEIFILKLFSYFSDGLKHKDLLTFAVPFFLFSLLISYLLDRKAGIFFTFLNIIPLTIFYLEKPKLILYAILSSFLASAGVNIYSRVERYSIIKFIILIILPFNAFLIFILSWAGNNFSDFIYMLGGMFLGIVFSLIFAPILIPALEISFGILSEIRLAELGNSEHPLLKKMAIEAPGTYHHSLMVSNLAEHAVRAIGGNYHLARVSALFHDMGKLDEPSYFIENQEKDFNIHDRLSPEKSSSIIINHISKGIEILKKARIPSLIREIVQQHHGESLIALFYHKALSETESKGGTPHESLFRYPGPKPQSKEAGILMLSDAVEAASKSLSEWNPETIKKMINEIITRFFEDGQLEESELTIKDLYVVASSFYNTFIKFYKQRIPYPGFEFQKDQLPIQ